MEFRLTDTALEDIEADVAIGFVYQGEGDGASCYRLLEHAVRRSRGGDGRAR